MPVVPSTLDDVIEEIRNNLMLVDKGQSCSWNLSPGSDPIIVRTINTLVEPPREFGVKVSVDKNHIDAEYFGFPEDPKHFEIPRLPNGDYDLRDDTPLWGICEEIASPLKHVRCA